MKRSEFLAAMQNEWGLLHRGGLSEASDEERLDLLLNWIISVGMLPPSHYGDNPEVHIDYVKSTYDCEWEREDETK